MQSMRGFLFMRKGLPQLGRQMGQALLKPLPKLPASPEMRGMESMPRINPSFPSRGVSPVQQAMPLEGLRRFMAKRPRPGAIPATQAPAFGRGNF